MDKSLHYFTISIWQILVLRFFDRAVLIKVLVIASTVKISSNDQSQLRCMVNTLTFPLNPTSTKVQQVARELHSACSTLGFFGHGIPLQLQEDLVSYSRKLFDLPLEEKMQLYLATEEFHGEDICHWKVKALMEDSKRRTLSWA